MLDEHNNRKMLVSLIWKNIQIRYCGFGRYMKVWCGRPSDERCLLTHFICLLITSIQWNNIAMPMIWSMKWFNSNSVGVTNDFTCDALSWSNVSNNNLCCYTERLTVLSMSRSRQSIGHVCACGMSWNARQKSECCPKQLEAAMTLCYVKNTIFSYS